MEKDIFHYYNNLADKYDEHRFGNSYGQFIHQQELRLLQQVIQPSDQAVLDLGCGTGRLLAFATHGLDLSPNMLQVAKQKYPSKKLIVGSALQMPFADNHFDLVYSFHLLMHLDKVQSRTLFAEANRIIKKGGRLIIDFPSANRRKLINAQTTGWHGANAFSIKQVLNVSGDHWRLHAYYGLMALPVHRIPLKLRKLVMPFDNWLCRSILKKYASYLVIELVKK